MGDIGTKPEKIETLPARPIEHPSIPERVPAPVPAKPREPQKV